MASLTPGVLSKLVENAGNSKFKVRGEHRSALLQVIEIVPSLDGDPFRTRGFFLKLSDSLHSAYVSISSEDIDLILSDKIQLGQFIYVSHFDLGLGSPVPVVSGLKVLPKRRPCVGTPKDLVSSDVLQLGFSSTSKSREKKKDGKKVKSLDLEMRRLSLDSARRAWDRSSTPRLRQHDNVRKVTSNKVSLSTKRLSLSTPPKTTKKEFKEDLMPQRLVKVSPKSTKKESREVLMPQHLVKVSPKTTKKESKEDLMPQHLVKVSLNCKTRFNQPTSWRVLPSTLQESGKEVVCHRNVAFLAAVSALEEASALEAVIYCLQAFSELCNSYQKLPTESLVEQFLVVNQRMQEVAEKINSLIYSCSTEAKSSTQRSLQTPTDLYNSTLSSKNAACWVHAAVETDLAKFSLYRKPEKCNIVNDNNYHVVLENNSPMNKPNPGNCYSSSSDIRGKQAPSIRKQLHPSIKTMNNERRERRKGSKLDDAANVAEKLLLVSRQWFLKYLEESFNSGFGLNIKRSSDIACLLRQLKRVNQWLDDLINAGVEADDRIEHLRKKLYSLLLEHVDCASK